MAKTEFPQGIDQRQGLDRRQLLASTTALSAAVILPGARAPEAPPPHALPSLPPTPEVRSPNFCAAHG